LTLTFGEAGAPPLLRDLTWRLGPGDRVALVGVNGSGKTTLLKLLAGELEADTGRVDRGTTVRLAFLSQDTAEIPGHLRVLESLEAVRGRATLSDGQEITASLLCDRFGFRGDKARTLVRDLSGGERRRLQLMRLLMDEPNVLLLDEPTNDLDIDTLTALEDLLDRWPGTLVVVSHDRYFVERVCDDVHALTGDGGLRHLPGGIDQYVRSRRAPAAPAPAPAPAKSAAPRTSGAPSPSPSPTPGTTAPAAGKLGLAAPVRRSSGRRIAVRATVSGPGTISAVVTTAAPRRPGTKAGGSLVAGRGRLTYARRATLRVSKAGRVTLVLGRTAAGRRARYAGRTVTARLVVRFTPTSGKPVVTTRVFRLRVR
jgi:ATP-binding cassette subfamily F protein uup